MTRAWLAFLAYCGLTIALTYPLILQLGSVLPNDAGDPALNTWILWWNAQAVPFTSNWWNAPAFYPVPGVLTFSENLLGLSLISTPLQWLGAAPQTAYNIVFLLTFPLSAIGAYLLALELTKRHDAAFIAGLLFGFAPYRIAHLPQIQSLAAFAMPFALLGLHRALRDPRPRWLVLFGVGWFIQGLCNGYYLLFFSVFLFMWLLWFASPWSRPRTFAAIAVTWCIAALAMLPMLWHYRAVHDGFGFTRDFGTIRDFGADVAGLLHPAAALAFWGTLNVYRRAEGELFPGLTITVLIIAGALFVRDQEPARAWKWVMVRRVVALAVVVTGLISLSALIMGPWRFNVAGIRLFSVSNPIKPLTGALALGIGLALTSPRLRHAYATRSLLGFYALAAFVMWLFSLGPAPSLMGKPLMYRGPYALLMLLPGFNSLRVPARFWMMTTLCLAVIGAIVFDRLASRFGQRRLIAAAVVALGVLADGWVSEMPLASAPLAWKAESCGGSSSGALVELPLGRPYSDVAAMYRSMSHGRPVVNGYSGYFPPHYAALRFGLALRDEDLLTQLATYGAADIVVDREEDPEGGWDDYVASHPGAQRICTEGNQTLYRLSGGPPATASAAGAPLPTSAIRPNVNARVAGLMADGDRTTRWESGPQTDRTMIEVDLGTVRSVGGVELLLGPFVEDFPRALLIEGSEDGQTWRELWRGGSAGLAFVGAFEAPRDVPLRYRFPASPARLLRLRLTAGDDTYYWSVAELKVLGP
jgi:hypothetical protein